MTIPFENECYHCRRPSVCGSESIGWHRRNKRRPIMATKFAGKIAVITGASTGMGLATAKRFVEEGMDHVFITGRRREALDAAVAVIGKNVTAVPGDVAN